MAIQQSRDSNIDRSDTKRPQTRLRRWARLSIDILLIVVLAVMGFLALYTILYAFKILFGLSPLDWFPSNLLPPIGSADGKGTGEVGDTFGGLLGPILTAAALLATLWVARSEGRRADTQFEDQRYRMKLERAEKIVAWIAETEHDTMLDTDDYWHGVVVQNDSGSVVNQLDIAIKVESADTPDAETAKASAPHDNPNGAHSTDTTSEWLTQDRESIIPPGTWFIPFNKRISGSADVTAAWQQVAPVAITNGQMTVSLNQESIDLEQGEPKQDKSAISKAFPLTLHTRLKLDDEQQPFYTVERLRYFVNGQHWTRRFNNETVGSTDIHPADAREDGFWNEEELKATEENQRTAARQSVPGVNRRTDTTVVNLQVATLRSLGCSELEEDDLIVQAKDGLDVNKPGLYGIARISLPTEGSATSSRLQLKLENGSTVELQGNKYQYPTAILLNSKRANVPLGQAAALKLYELTNGKRGGKKGNGKGNAGALGQNPQYWIENESHWFAILQEIANKARDELLSAEESAD